MEYNYFGYGYRVGWFTEELQSSQKRFEDGKWYAADTKYYDPYAPLINRGVIAKIPEYKYSAYLHYTGRDIISYLRIYERFPQTEYMLKNGLCAYVENISLLKKFGKDKKFCKWFIRHRKELALPYGNTYNVTTIREAYKTGRPLDEVKHFLFACVGTGKKCLDFLAGILIVTAKDAVSNTDSSIITFVGGLVHILDNMVAVAENDLIRIGVQNS